MFALEVVLLAPMTLSLAVVSAGLAIKVYQCAVNVLKAMLEMKMEIASKVRDTSVSVFSVGLRTRIRFQKQSKALQLWNFHGWGLKFSPITAHEIFEGKNLQIGLSINVVIVATLLKN